MAETIQIHFPGAARVVAEYAGFTVTADQPVEDGGENTAPAPFDYFLISIGTCAGYYAKKFLDKRGLETEGFRVELNATRDGETGMFSEIEIKLLLPRGFPAKYEKAIAKSVNSCSVKKHILDPPRFPVRVEIAS
jgi:ribosomal protein S12 methylthiotransferase accessory factor